MGQRKSGRSLHKFSSQSLPGFEGKKMTQEEEKEQRELEPVLWSSRRLLCGECSEQVE